MDSKLILLNYRIEIMRAKLNKLILNKDINDKKVLEYSRRLDKLLVEYLHTSLGIKEAA